MTQTSFEVTGVDSLTRRLRSLADLPEHIAEDCAGPIQEIMRATAVDRLTGLLAVDTGLLRRSVETDDGYNSFVEKGDSKVSVGIRNDVSYALFIEYGTGPKGDPEIPHTSKETWVYPTGRTTKDGREEFRTAHSQPARPFMRPALYDNRKAFIGIIKDEIKEVWADDRPHRAVHGDRPGNHREMLHGMAP